MPPLHHQRRRCSAPPPKSARPAPPSPTVVQHRPSPTHDIAGEGTVRPSSPLAAISAMRPHPSLTPSRLECSSIRTPPPHLVPICLRLCLPPRHAAAEASCVLPLGPGVLSVPQHRALHRQLLLHQAVQSVGSSASHPTTVRCFAGEPRPRRFPCLHSCWLL